VAKEGVTNRRRQDDIVEVDRRIGIAFDEPLSATHESVYKAVADRRRYFPERAVSGKSAGVSTANDLGDR
jgi:hypothetical protein